MSDGNTLIGNVLVGHGLDQANNATGGVVDQNDETYLAAASEEGVLEQEEEQIMTAAEEDAEEEVTSEDDEHMERHMLTVALVNSVVESSMPVTASKPDNQGEEGKPKDGDSNQRYSLRKRRRPTGEPSEDPGTQSPSRKKKETINSLNIRNSAAKPPEGSTRPAKVAMLQPDKAKGSHPTPPSTSSGIIASIPISKLKTESVPACTIIIPSTPLHVNLPSSSLPMPSSLPPALQPPLQPKLPLPSKTNTSTTNIRIQRPKPRLTPPAPAVVSTTSKPLTPNPAAIGVPNPLSQPLPASKPILVSKQKKPPASLAHNSFKAGAKLTVPCPLPPSSFDGMNTADDSNSQTLPLSLSEQVTGKKKVTIDPEPVTIDPEPTPARGRIFSIDMDPASLDFSVLDSGESGTPAPASDDLPLVTGGGRDRAFSFECFAFGINADEPLPPLSEQSETENDGTNDSQHFVFPRPRGDSIIFDPSSFQEGGIHEEHALTTRESRGMSIDLDAIIMSSSSSHAPPDRDFQHPGNPSYADNCAPPPAPVSSAGASDPPGTELLPDEPQNCHLATTTHYPGNAASNYHVPHSHAPPPPPPSHYSHHHHHMAHSTNGHPHPHAVNSANPIPHEVTITSGPAVSTVIGATSTALQMELLNKDGRIGIYLPEARKERIARFHAKRKMRIWRKRIKYDCRKKLADSRPRIKGRFVKRTDMD